MLLDVRIVFTLGEEGVTGREHKGGFWGPGNIPFLDFGVGDMAVFSL